MTTLAMNMPGTLSASGEVPGTGKVWRQGDVFPVKTIFPMRQCSSGEGAFLQKVKKMSLADWRKLVGDDVEMLRKLMKKTTDSQRLRAHMSEDERGIREYLKHADLDNFPDRLLWVAYLTNRSIKDVLAAL